MQTKPMELGGPGSPPEQDVRIELDAVLQSQIFRKSERHSHFLRFICETTLAGEAAKLNEYLIAQEVFGRGPDYSPGEDSVVRRQAYSLRQKLQDYYAHEGKDDAVRIELPTGRYVPAFVDARPQAQPAVDARPAVVAVEQAPAAAPESHLPYQWAVAMVVVSIVSLAAGFWIRSLVQGGRATGRIDPAVGEIWGSWLTDPAGAVICFSNPLTAIVKQNEQRFPPQTLPHRIELGEAEAQPLREEFHLPPGGYLYLSPGIGHAKMGEALGSIALSVFFTKAGIPVQTTQSRFLNWEDFRTQNLILMGHDEANRWLDPLLKKLPLRLAATEINRPRRIVNTKPAPGEKSDYQIDYATAYGQPSDDYGLISMLTGIDGRHRLLLVNGVNAEGTRTALEFLTDPANLAILLSALRKASPGHKGEWHFQMVLHAEVRDKIPTRADLILVRVL